MPFLREAYPYLEPRYAKYYRGPYAPKSYTAEVYETLRELKEKWGMADRAAAPAPTRGQLALAL